jgi:sulfatase modifying factor 1
MMRHGSFRYLLSIVGLGLAATVAQAEISIDTVPVLNTGNIADSTGFGAVDYAYRIGTYEVTAGQYTGFLNAMAATDNYGLYSTDMLSTWGCQIERSGSPGSYTYSVASEWADRPVNYVSFWDAARFANWLHNGQGTGDTESGAYTNIGNDLEFARQPGARFFIPTEDEWYKAAYHKNNGDTGDYFMYPTSSNATPSNLLVDPDPGNNATFYTDETHDTIGSPYYRTEVGAHENSESPYGTFDQGGNVWEWNETDVVGSFRGIRGGSYSIFLGGDTYLRDSESSGYRPANEDFYLGFRVASSAMVPEPGSMVMLCSGLGVIGLLWWRRRK